MGEKYSHVEYKIKQSIETGDFEIRKRQIKNHARILLRQMAKHCIYAYRSSEKFLGEKRRNCSKNGDSYNQGLKVDSNAGLDLDLGLGLLKVWAWTGLGPENQVQVQGGLQDLATFNPWLQ